jgi:hypothetical protein
MTNKRNHYRASGASRPYEWNLCELVDNSLEAVTRAHHENHHGQAAGAAAHHIAVRLVILNMTDSGRKGTHRPYGP